MTSRILTIGGMERMISDIDSYRAKLIGTREKLCKIYVGFDPEKPDALLDREAEIVTLANRSEELREIVERWDAAETARANVLAGWTIVQQLDGDTP